MIEVESLGYTAGRFSLRDISFSVAPGETLIMLGPTGAGKTVLLELIAGFRTPKTGAISFEGKDMTNLPPERRHVGIVYQDYMLFPHLNVHDNIAYGLRAAGKMRSKEIESKVSLIASQLKITHLIERRTARLSGGEQQRIALARALVTEPKLLLLDEPFGAVDPNTKEKLMRELSKTLDAWNIPVLYVTHDQIEAVEMADRMAVMNEGRIIQMGPTKEIFSAPKSEFVADFVGIRNIYRGKAIRSDGVTIVQIGAVQLFSSIEMEGDVHVTLRPEDIIVSKKPLESSARNSQRGRVVSIAERGPVINLTADCGIEITASITKESFREMHMTLEDDIYLTFKAPSVNLF